MAARGRPTGSRDKLRNNFLHALAEDFTAHGSAAIVSMRENDPTGYIRAIASLMPKEMDIKRQESPLDHLTDEQLQQIIEHAERFLSAQSGGEPVAAVEGAAQPPEKLSPLH